MRTIITPSRYFSVIRKSLILLFSCLPMLIFAQQQLPGTAPVAVPTSGFAIDGSVHRLLTPGDWRSIYNSNPEAAGTYILKKISVTGGLSAEPVYSGNNSTAFVKDPYNTTSDKIFTTGSKFAMGVGIGSDKLQWGTGKATGKNDINNGMFYIGLASNGDRWLIMGGDRYSVQGTSYIDFEFLQRELRVDAGGTFSYTPDPVSDPPPALVNGKTPKDFVLSIAYTKGGSTVGVYLYVWQNDGTYSLETIPAGIAYAKTNEASVPVDFTAFGSATYDPYAFVEAAVNITELYKQVIGGGYSDCQGAVYQSMFIKTKASDAMDAALKDFIEPQSINLSFDQLTLSYSPSSACIGDGPINPTINGGSPTTKSFSASPAGLSINEATGVISAGSAPGSYIVTMLYSINGCNGSTTAPVTIKPTPSIALSAIPTTSCGGTSISVPYTAVTAGSTYSIDFPTPPFADVTNQALPASSPISYTIPGNLSAGNYNGTITLTKDGCSSAPYNIQFTVPAPPDAPTYTTVDPSLCSATPDGKIIILTPGAGYSYMLKTGSTEGSYQPWLNLTEIGANRGYTGLAGNNYTLYVKDGNNCIASTAVNCAAPPEEKANTGAVAQSNATYLGSAELKLGVSVKPMPNPFSNQVRFMIEASEGGTGSLELYNMQGQKVKTIFNGYIHAGSNYFDLKMSGQNTGQYMYVLRMGSEKVSGKLLRTN